MAHIINTYLKYLVLFCQVEIVYKMVAKTGIIPNKVLQYIDAKKQIINKISKWKI